MNRKEGEERDITNKREELGIVLREEEIERR